MKYSLVIFDLDGTILDTLDDLSDSVNFALKNNNLPLRTKKEVRSFVGNGIKLLIERAVPEETPECLTDKVFVDFRQYYALHSCDNTKPYEGIIEVLFNLRNNGIKTAVVSNKADFAVQELIDKYFHGLFDFVTGEREGISKKPAPDTVFEAVRKTSSELSSAVYVGDSEVDIETAKNAGINCVITDWGFRDREQLIFAGADTIVSDTQSLLAELL